MRRPLVALFALALAPAAAAQGWLDSARWYLQPTLDQFHAIADVDADGDDDLFMFRSVTQGSNNKLVSFQVWFNDGTGQFPTQGPLVSVPVTAGFWRPADGNGVRRMTDVTGDGLVDLLLVEESTSFTPDVAVHVLPGLGGGAFAAPVSIPMVGDALGITFGQADGDAAREIAITEEAGNSEHTRWYDWNGAGFTASPEAFIFGGLGSPAVARLVALDLDTDGDDDLVFGQMHGQNLRIMNTVNGTPVLGQLLTVGAASGVALYPFVTDLVGGGAQDLLVLEQVVGGTSGWFVPVLNQGGTLVQGAKQGFAGSSFFGSNAEVDDWDADGDPDVLLFGWQMPGGSTDAYVSLWSNDGTDDWQVEISGVPQGPAALLDMGSLAANSAVGCADLDDDGHLEAIGPQTVYFGRSLFESTPTKVVDFFFGFEPAVVLDAEGDGDVDLFYRSGGARLNNATGACPTLYPLPIVPIGKESPFTSSIGDFTGDGLPDLLTLWQIPAIDLFHPPVFAEMRLVKDNGLGALVDGGTASLSQISPYSRTTCLAHDFDADGDVDVWGNQTGYWPNDGAGHFATQTFLPGDGQTEAAAVGDTDGDGDIDVAALSSQDKLRLLVHRTPGVYTAVVAGIIPFGGDVDSITLADHDADGDLDLSACTAFANLLHLYENDGEGSFEAPLTLSTSLTTGIDPLLGVHAFQDLDGDGITDLLAGPLAPTNGGNFANKVAVFRGTGGGFEPARWYLGTAMGAAADADGDGDLDLIGRSVVRSRLFEGAADGKIRQYGSGTPALSEVAPLLGAAGPLRPGSTTAALKIRRGVGGAPALLLYGFGEAAVAGQPFANATLWVAQPYFTLLLTLGGTPGAHGQGALDLGLAPVLPAIAGLTIYHQLAVFGGPGNGRSASNGLQLTYGL